MLVFFLLHVQISNVDDVCGDEDEPINQVQGSTAENSDFLEATGILNNGTNVGLSS